MKKITLAVALLAAALGAAAQDKACPPADEKKAEAAIDRVVNWDLLYKSWQEYRHCDKGSVGEGFTEALMRLIVDWKQVDVLAKQVEANREYRDFVHRHIDSPAAKGDVDSIYSRATKSCPKGLDSFCPMGPAILTADEVPDPTKLVLTTWVNGEQRQKAPVADLIFDIPTLIETISAGITLMPGDIIATGTPAGVGIGFKPPKFLKPGDVVAMEVDGIGRLSNPVR